MPENIPTSFPVLEEEMRQIAVPSLAGPAQTSATLSCTRHIYSFYNFLRLVDALATLENVSTLMSSSSSSFSSLSPPPVHRRADPPRRVAGGQEDLGQQVILITNY